MQKYWCAENLAILSETGYNKIFVNFQFGSWEYGQFKLCNMQPCMHFACEGMICTYHAGSILGSCAWEEFQVSNVVRGTCACTTSHLILDVYVSKRGEMSRSSGRPILSCVFGNLCSLLWGVSIALFSRWVGILTSSFFYTFMKRWNVRLKAWGYNCYLYFLQTKFLEVNNETWFDTIGLRAPWCN